MIVNYKINSYFCPSTSKTNLLCEYANCYGKKTDVRQKPSNKSNELFPIKRSQRRSDHPNIIKKCNPKSERRKRFLVSATQIPNIFLLWRHLTNSYLQIFASFLFVSLWQLAQSQSSRKVHFGFPDKWDGDKHRDLYCPSKNIPKFIDGYFLCQLSASYGDHRAPAGQRLSHMIDAIGAVGSFRISNGQVTFSAQYYPARPYKIWEFYDRNMSKASVPWVGWSDYNVSAMAKWEQIPENSNSARFHPNLDFWRVGKKILAGTEAPYWVGYEFDVRTLSNFKLFPFVERNEIFGNPRPSLIPISMAIHERVTRIDDTIWGSFSAMNFKEQRFFQGIFTVNNEGVRRVVGMYDYGVWDADACAQNDEYIGDKNQLPGYIHSITSTKNYIVLPITSLLINPCKFKEPPHSNPQSDIQNGGLWGMDFYEMVPVRFLIYNKKTNSWVTQKPLEVFSSMFITHQLNAYEDKETSNIVADMIYPKTARVLRFRLDIEEMKVMYSYLIPQETIAADYPQINHAYDSQPYEWAYMVEHPFAADNSILKINVDNPGGQRNQKFQPIDGNSQIVLHEPWFVQRPQPKTEDDGILLVRALDLSENKGVLFVVDATTMLEVGRAHVPISVPFGFHNRFFLREDLGIAEGFEHPIIDDLSAMAASARRAFRPNSWRRRGGANQTQFWSRILATTTTTIPPSWIYVRPITTSTVPPTEASTVLPRWITTFDPPRATNPMPYPLPHPNPRSAPTRLIVKPYLPKTVTSSLRPSSFHSRNSNTRLQPKIVPPPYPSSYESLETLPQPQKLELQTGETEIEKTVVPSIKIISGMSGGYNRVVDERGGKRGKVAEMTLRQVYEKSLRALCRWLPKILQNVTIDGCVDSDNYTTRWMKPNFTARVSENGFQSDEKLDSEEKNLNFQSQNNYAHFQMQHAKSLKEIRPILKPVYTPQIGTAPWYNYRHATRIPYPNPFH